MSDPDGITEATAALRSPLEPLAGTVAALARRPGLLAWWAPRTVLPTLGGSPHPDDERVRLLEVGEATMLRNRVTRQDLYRCGVSRLRRVIAGLLLDDLGLVPTWAADVVLPRADEDRLTAWMRERLSLSWCEREDRRELLPGVVAATGPGIDVDAETARTAEERFVAAAGEKPVRVVGVPFQRP